MVKTLFLHLLLILITTFSCTSKKASKEESLPLQLSTDTLQSQVEVVPPPAPFQKLNSTTDFPFQLGNKVFVLGAENHLKGCKFQFACDCCSGDLIFLPDSTFYYTNYCMADITVTRGHYIIQRDSLHLRSDGIQVKEEYNWERESNPTAQEFFIKDTIINPYSMDFKIQRCNEHSILVDEGKNGTFVALPKDSSVDAEMRVLEKKGIMAYFGKNPR